MNQKRTQDASKLIPHSVILADTFVILMCSNLNLLSFADRSFDFSKFWRVVAQVFMFDTQSVNVDSASCRMRLLCIGFV